VRRSEGERSEGAAAAAVCASSMNERATEVATEWRAQSLKHAEDMLGSVLWPVFRKQESTSKLVELVRFVMPTLSYSHSDYTGLEHNGTTTADRQLCAYALFNVSMNLADEASRQQDFERANFHLAAFMVLEVARFRCSPLSAQRAWPCDSQGDAHMNFALDILLRMPKHVRLGTGTGGFDTVYELLFRCALEMYTGTHGTRAFVEMLCTVWLRALGHNQWAPHRFLPVVMQLADGDGDQCAHERHRSAVALFGALLCHASLCENGGGGGGGELLRELLLQHVWKTHARVNVALAATPRDTDTPLLRAMLREWVYGAPDMLCSTDALCCLLRGRESFAVPRLWSLLRSLTTQLVLAPCSLACHLDALLIADGDHDDSVEFSDIRGNVRDLIGFRRARISRALDLLCDERFAAHGAEQRDSYHKQGEWLRSVALRLADAANMLADSEKKTRAQRRRRAHSMEQD
jgi:hypothetical protein